MLRSVHNSNMKPSALRVLWVGRPQVSAEQALNRAGFGPFELVACDAAEVHERLGRDGFGVLVVQEPWDDWVRCAQTVAVVLVRDDAAPGDVIGWLRDGAQDVLSTAEVALPACWFRLRAAAERQQVRLGMRQAFATDVHTGLPHAGQLVEHMSHLLALREREPAPMALLVFRVEGLATTLARLGAEAAGALRRKVAVRLRAGVRASDVVASVGDDSFAVLLSLIDSPGDAYRVGRKLLVSLAETFKLGGQDVAVATALGIAAYPADGSQPDVLLRRAAGLAAAAQASGRAGHSNFVESGAPPAGAANDE